jgi:type II secretory pathway pseudopilin PulG
MNPASASAAEDRGRMPAAGSSGLRLVLGLGKLPAARGHPAAHLNLNESAPPSPTFHLPSPTRPKAAFTLIELMVAGAITTLMLLGMTGIFDQSMKAWRLSSRRGDAEREVRAAMATVERDLGGLVLGPGLPLYVGRFEPSVVGIAASNYPNLAPQSASGAWSNVSTALFFASAQRPDAASPGDISGVGYYVAWDPQSNEGRGAYNLYRYFQPPQPFFGDTTNFFKNGGTLYRQNNRDEIVGANVINFWAQLVTIPAGLTASPINLPTSGSITARPKYIQLELTSYGSEAVRSFSTREDWGNTNNIKKFGRSFIWRVDL